MMMTKKHTACPYEKKPDVILDHLEGVLPERENERFARHLASCSRCAAELAEYAEILALARSGPPPTPAPGTADRLRTAIRREIAAAGTGDAGRTRAARAPRPHWLVASWRGFAIGIPALAAIAFVVMRLTLHEPVQPRATPEAHATREQAAAAAADSGSMRIAAADVASSPALEGEISAYESDRMLELGTDAATEEMDQSEQQAFVRLLDQELEALMRKRAASGERSSLSVSPEELS